MDCISLSNFTEVHIYEAEKKADLIELRIDTLDSIRFDWLAKIKCKKPLLFTLRSKEEGGNFTGSPQDYYNILIKLAMLKPDYLDIEARSPPELVHTLSAFSKIILSKHNFIETPKDLVTPLNEMKKIPAHFYKYVTMAHNSIDALRLLNILKTEENLIAFTMGEKGRFSRILAPTFGSPISYTYETNAQDPGQIPIDELKTYQRAIKTPFLALIGTPLDKSPSQLSHNALLAHECLSGVYVKIPLNEKELPLAFQLLKKLEVAGLSITMPLKEEIQKLLPKNNLPSCNTLSLTNGIEAINTDAPATIKLLKEKTALKHTKIVILGGGGLAKAIIASLQKEGARLYGINRTPSKIKALNIESIQENELKNLEYSILINCTPLSMPIKEEYIHPKTIIMETNIRPKFSKLLKVSQEKHCSLIFGYELFLYQALLQFKLWYKNHKFSTSAKKCLLQNIHSFLK
jgi:3-dehydroquinate dehydratase/shikimate dehydrogenase